MKAIKSKLMLIGCCIVNINDDASGKACSLFKCSHTFGHIVHIGICDVILADQLWT